MKNELSFETISNDILNNKEFQKIAYEQHHGITRMDHTLRVAKYAYKIAKTLKMDYESATRAALLHDFFYDKEYGDIKGLKKGVVHPELAYINAEREFGVNDIEANAIRSHMFPMNKELPKYKESWLLTIVDKSVAIYECISYKFNYIKITNQLKTNVNFASVFLFYLLTVGRK